jgi:hypothetical protein
MTGAFVLSVAAVLTVCTNAAYGQSACVKGRPFTAQVTERAIIQKPDGTELEIEFSGTMARDSRGRVYTALPGTKIQLQKSPGPTGDRVLREYRPLPDSYSPSLSNCEIGENIRLDLSSRVARVTKYDVATLWNPEKSSSYFEFLTSEPEPPNATIEDLGFKQLAGLLAHGYRQTIIGTKDDGPWNGKPMIITECWISDDLAETILRVRKNLTTATTQHTTTLDQIERKEPATSLFEIPSGYKVASY